jgi:DNA-binding transcriptional ArsR family regulator
MYGDADISIPAGLLSDPARARVLLALADGRALPASMLATEAGVAASTASEHLAKLCAAGMLSVEPHGRHRYYRIADPRVINAVEALAEISPRAPVRSLRQGTRANALRHARLCYDHLAGGLGVALMTALVETGALDGGDGGYHREAARTDRLSAPGHDVGYKLTDHGAALVGDFGVDLAALRARRRPLIRYCLDWTEQRHHLARGTRRRTRRAAVRARLGAPCPAGQPGRPAHRRRPRRARRHLRPEPRRRLPRRELKLGCDRPPLPF